MAMAPMPRNTTSTAIPAAIGSQRRLVVVAIVGDSRRGSASSRAVPAPGVFGPTVHQIGRRHVLHGHAERLEDRHLVGVDGGRRPGRAAPRPARRRRATRRSGLRGSPARRRRIRPAPRPASRRPGGPRATSAGAISRWSGRQAPTEMTCAPRRHPGVVDDRRRRRGDQHDDVGAAHGLLGRRARPDRRRHACPPCRRRSARGCAPADSTPARRRGPAPRPAPRGGCAPARRCRGSPGDWRRAAPSPWPTPPRPPPSAPR